jgi:hypothetical protein
LEKGEGRALERRAEPRHIRGAESMPSTQISATPVGWLRVA